MTESAKLPEDTGGDDLYTNRKLVIRLLQLAWRYRWGCILIVILQAVLLTLGMLGLGLMGLGIDFIRYETALTRRDAAAASMSSPVPLSPGSTAAARAAPPAAKAPPPKPPSWPYGLQPPSTWSRMVVLGVIAVSILAFAIARSFLNIWYTIGMNKLVQGHIVVDLRAEVYARMQRLSFRFFDANASGALINRVTGDVQSVRGFVDGVVMQTVIVIVSLVVYAAYMVRLHPGLTLACLVTTPLLWTATARFSRTVRPAYARNRELFDDQILALSENIQGVHVVKGFARHREEIAKFNATADAVSNQKHWIFRKISIFQPLIHFLTNINLIVMLGYGGYLVVCYEQAATVELARQAGISIGQLLVFTGLLQQFSGQVTNVAGIADQIQQSLTGARRVFEVIDAPVEIVSPANPIRPERIRGEVSFDHVTFCYKPGEPAVDDVSFTAPAGGIVAVLGATGSGKSTLLSLVPRFYDPTSGCVRLDGQDVRELDVEQLRRSIGIVFQESFLFSNTVSANIAFGNPAATREQIEKAARVAAAHEFIMEMPDGYDTVLREGGANLSGGQRQRLAIARAILLEPPILLLDDPTAAIDPGTEEDIFKAMESATQGRTTFIVAHRLSTLRRADLVIVLDRGRVVQAGTHEQLMATRGHYRRAARLQIPDAESLRILGQTEGSSA